MSALFYPTRRSDSEERERIEANEAQVDKLIRWTEKPFPIDLRPASKTPFLHQFSSMQLREGLIHAVTTRRALSSELEQLWAVQQKQYAREAFVPVFQKVKDNIVAELEKASNECDKEAMLDDDVLENDDTAKAIREWDELTTYDPERMLRYTICIVSRINGKLRASVGELRRAIAVAQGDLGE